MIRHTRGHTSPSPGSPGRCDTSRPWRGQEGGGERGVLLVSEVVLADIGVAIVVLLSYSDHHHVLNSSPVTDLNQSLPWSS